MSQAEVGDDLESASVRLWGRAQDLTGSTARMTTSPMS